MPNYVTKTCENCKKDFTTLFKYRNKQKYCSKFCVGQSYIGEGNPAYGKIYNTKELNPEWAANISKSLKGKIHLGDSNPMKRPDVSKKMSESRKIMLRDPEIRRILGEKVKQAWIDGKYEGARVGQCKWYNHIRPNGDLIKLQGTWELAFAKWMDANDVDYVAHRGRISYIDNKGCVRSYYPDFFVPSWEAWIDVKCDYFMEMQKDKFDMIAECNPDKKIIIVGKQQLTELGIDLKAK